MDSAIQQEFYSSDELDRNFIGLQKINTAFALNDEMEEGALVYKFMQEVSKKVEWFENYP